MLEGFSGGIIVAVVDFFMVFLVLSGLAGSIVLLRKATAFWEQWTAVSEETPAALPMQPVAKAPVKDRTTTSHIAAIMAAIQEFTGLPIGSFTLTSVTPCEVGPTEVVNTAHIAAISAAIYEYAAVPAGSFRIAGIKHLGSADSWKIAGRMELMDRAS